MDFILNHGFERNDNFKKKYLELFEEDPFTANFYLLICELADKDGFIQFSPEEDTMLGEISVLMKIRFEDPKEYQL